MFKETGDSRYIYQNEVDKVCFQHDMAYGDFKDCLETASDKVLRDKAFNIAKIQNMMNIKEVLLFFYKVFDKKFLVLVLQLALLQVHGQKS